MNMLIELTATAWHRWFLDRTTEFWRAELGLPRPGELRARVVGVIEETADTRTFVLAVGRRWPGHRAGQFVTVELEVDGVRMRRCYSISSGGSPPGAARIAITVQRVPGGRVSSWLHEHVRAGHALTLGRPAGEFVVDAPAAPLLLVAGGSGVTPIMAIVRDLEARGLLRDVVVLHAARSHSHAVFARELAAIAAADPALRVIGHRDATHGRLDADRLRKLVPDLARRHVYVCGPAGLIDLVSTVATAAGAPVRHERFVAQAPLRVPTAGEPVMVHLSGRAVRVAGAAPLLDELERAGERPAHGCRIGICNTCRCRKQRGTVENLVTGVVSSEPEDIRLCVSIARSDLELSP